MAEDRHVGQTMPGSVSESGQAQNGQEALDLVLKASPDVLLTEYLDHEFVRPGQHSAKIVVGIGDQANRAGDAGYAEP